MITMTLHKHVMICATLLSVALTALAATTHTIGISLVASPPKSDSTTMEKFTARMEVSWSKLVT